MFWVFTWIPGFSGCDPCDTHTWSESRIPTPVHASVRGHQETVVGFREGRPWEAFKCSCLSPPFWWLAYLRVQLQSRCSCATFTFCYQTHGREQWSENSSGMGNLGVAAGDQILLLVFMFAQYVNWGPLLPKSYMSQCLMRSKSCQWKKALSTPKCLRLRLKNWRNLPCRSSSLGHWFVFGQQWTRLWSSGQSAGAREPPAGTGVEGGSGHLSHWCGEKTQSVSGSSLCSLSMLTNGEWPHLVVGSCPNPVKSLELNELMRPH